METQNQNINKFSWRRVLDFGLLYKSAIANQFIIFFVIITLAYLCLLPVRGFKTEANFAFYTMMSVLVAYCLYAGPLIFSRRDDSLLTQVPATIGEKTAFCLIYSIIVVPLFVEGVWYSFNIIGGIILDNGDIDKAIKSTVLSKYNFEFTPKIIAATIVNTVCQTAAIVLTVLFVVIKAKKYRFIKGLLTPLLVLLTLGIIGGIYGIVVAIAEFDNSGLSFAEPSQGKFLEHVLLEVSTITFAADFALVIYSVIIGYCIYLHNKKHQVA